jgi:hypothetical protein
LVIAYTKAWSITAWRPDTEGEKAECVGCGGKPRPKNRTCGTRECIAKALCYSGLIAQPTVKCLNAWIKRSVRKQMDELDMTRDKPRQLLAGLTQYYERL